MHKAAFLTFLLTVFTGAAAAQDMPDSVVAGTVPFEMSVLTTGLEGPWELTWGPDDKLWVTERTAGRISQIDPADGTKTTLIEIAEVFAPGGQDGLLGMALDPGLLQGTGQGSVYAAYTYVDEARGANPQVADPASPYRFLRTKIVRLTYDPTSNTLGQPVDVIAGLPASNDHNSGRLKLGPDGKLYYTIGDGGKDQLGNWCLPIEAQRLPSTDELAAENYIAYQGKSLRLNPDGSIPDDNPVIDGVQSHIFTFGHRNMQGIAFAPDGTLYASEQGPKTDDEVNVLVGGGNYGWPHIAGFRDDKAYQYARWADATTPCAELEFSDLSIDPSVPVEDESDWIQPFNKPLATLFTVPSDYNFADPKCEGINFICWPTVAASSIEAYMPEAEVIPGWGNSLLVTTLKRGSIYRLPLDAAGTGLAGPIERYFQSEDRFRDIAISPDMKTIYIATDVSGLAGTADGGVTTTMQHPGAILVFRHTGAAVAQTEIAPVASAAVAAATEASLAVPFTTEQAARGKIAYDANCVSCHGASLTGSYGPPLTGQYFEGKWLGKPLADLLAKVHSMPPSRPDSLGDATYADLVAYILQRNDFASGDVELSTDASMVDSIAINRGTGW